LPVERSLADGRFAPALLVHGGVPVGNPLHDGDELHELGPQFIPKETVYLQRMVAVRSVNGAQHIAVHAVLLQILPAAHDLIETPFTALVDTVGIMHRLGSVHAEADEEAVLLEKTRTTHRRVECRWSGCCRQSAEPAFYAVRQGQPSAGKNQDPLESAPALPGNRHFGRLMRFQQLPDVGSQDFIAHAKTAAG